jgi:hypothetical protein
VRNDEDDIEADLFLVFPADARSSDVMKPKLSIFTQTGLSLLGRRVGDRIDVRLRILDLPYQPEAAGDFESVGSRSTETRRNDPGALDRAAVGCRCILDVRWVQ